MVREQLDPTPAFDIIFAFMGRMHEVATRLVAIASDNATFHERLVGDLREGVAKGSISVADQQQPKNACSRPVPA